MHKLALGPDAEPLPRIAAAAAAAGVAVLVSYPERDGDAFYCAATVFDKDGV